MMNRRLIAASILALSLASVGTESAEAAGCLKGAAVGGVAGHFAGHHAILGALAGCAIGHHRAAVNRRRDQQIQDQGSNTEPPTKM